MEPEQIIDEREINRTFLVVCSLLVIVWIIIGIHYQLRYSAFFRPLRVGFEFDFPKGMNVTEHRMLKKGSLRDWGMILGFDENESIMITWFPIYGEEELDDKLILFGKKGEYRIIERGVLTKSSINGHDMIFRTFIAKSVNETLYCVGSNWFCTKSKREFYFYVMSYSNDVQPLFDKYLENFKCHTIW